MALGALDRWHLFNLLMNAGPNATTFTLAPIFFPTQLRATASGFAAGVAKIGATFGVFVLPILKGKIRHSSRPGNGGGCQRSGSDRHFGLWARRYGIARDRETLLACPHLRSRL
jgi:hypothetical protein